MKYIWRKSDLCGVYKSTILRFLICTTSLTVFPEENKKESRMKTKKWRTDTLAINQSTTVWLKILKHRSVKVKWSSHKTRTKVVSSSVSICFHYAFHCNIFTEAFFLFLTHSPELKLLWCTTFTDGETVQFVLHIKRWRSSFNMLECTECIKPHPAPLMNKNLNESYSLKGEHLTFKS